MKWKLNSYVSTLCVSPLSSSLLLSGIAAIPAGFLDDGAGKTTLALIGKFGASASFSIVYLYTAELYPTQVRSTAIGMCSMMARIGGVAAPQVISTFYYVLLFSLCIETPIHQSYWVHTVWKFKDFSGIQILREINYIWFSSIWRYRITKDGCHVKSDWQEMCFSTLWIFGKITHFNADMVIGKYFWYLFVYPFGYLVTLLCRDWCKKMGKIQLFCHIWLCTKFHYSLQCPKSKTDLLKTQMDNFFLFTKIETLSYKNWKFMTIFKAFFRFKALYKSWSHPYHFLSLDCNFLANSGSRVDANGHHGQLFYFGWPFVLAFTRNFRGFTTWDHWRNRLVEAKRQKFFPMLVKSQTPDSNARTWKGQEKVTLTKFTTYTVWKIKVFSTT